MTDVELLVVALAAGLGAVLTAVAGLGGGILLLAVLLQFEDPAVVVPVHGVIQLASNSSRAVILRQRIEWALVMRFGALLIPAGLLGLLVAKTLPTALGRASIALFALVAVWRPGVLSSIAAKLGRGDRTFVVLGGVAGFLNIPLGVTGPAVAPFFRLRLSERTAMVATFAATQVLGHLTKVGIFGVDGFNFAEHWPLMAAGSAAVIIGSFIGTRLLGRVSEALFQWLFRCAITIVAIRLIVQAVI